MWPVLWNLEGYTISTHFRELGLGSLTPLSIIFQLYLSVLLVEVNPVFALFFFHLVAEKPNLEKFSIYSNKFFHNFHLSESSFTCSGTSGKWVSVKTVNRSTQRKPPTCCKSLTKVVVIGTDYIGCCKSNYHTITTTMGFL